MYYLYIKNENDFNEILKKYDINEVKIGKYGKKYCDNVFFNISHSYDKHVIVISDVEIGIDIEKIRDYNKILLSCLSKKEISEMKDEKDFWKYWTLKESFIKCKGIYLENNLNKISFNTLDKNNIKCYYNNTEQAMKFEIIETEDYIISICLKK